MSMNDIRENIVSVQNINSEEPTKSPIFFIISENGAEGTQKERVKDSLDENEELEEDLEEIESLDTQIERREVRSIVNELELRWKGNSYCIPLSQKLTILGHSRAHRNSIMNMSPDYLNGTASSLRTKIIRVLSHSNKRLHGQT